MSYVNQPNAPFPAPASSSVFVGSKIIGGTQPLVNNQGQVVDVNPVGTSTMSYLLRNSSNQVIGAYTPPLVSGSTVENPNPFSVNVQGQTIGAGSSYTFGAGSGVGTGDTTINSFPSWIWLLLIGGFLLIKK